MNLSHGIDPATFKGSVELSSLIQFRRAMLLLLQLISATLYHSAITKLAAIKGGTLQAKYEM